MPEDNVSVVRGLFENFLAGDLLALKATLAPEVIWYGAEPGTSCKGRDAVTEFLGRQRGFRPVLEETVESGDTVLAVIRVPGIAQAQQRERDEHGYHVMTLASGKITEVRDYPDRETAMRQLQP